MTDKKTELKRLLIFLFFAFALSWIPAIIFNKTLGYHEWFETYRYPITFWFVGYGPALANIITRKLTHEGWKDSMLHLKLKENLKYYIIAVLIVSVLSIPQGVIITFVYGNWSEFGKSMPLQESVSSLFTIFAIAPLMAFNTFGEEFGWRGYMNGKLETLIGTTGTAVVGGIIWGLWHAELTVAGHNFGTDYPGYPYLGMFAMCVSCTFQGIGLMWLTKKTGSVYPAAIMHAMNNFGGSITGQLLISGVPEDLTLSIPQMLLTEIPSYIAYTVLLILMIRDNKTEGQKIKFS